MLTAVGLGLLGAVSNLFTIQMFANTSLVMGGFFCMLAAILMRPQYALLVALLSCVGLWINWQHAWGFLWFPLEVLFVSQMIRQRIHALVADILYWILIGIPLLYLVLISVEDMSPPMLATILVKQALNGYLYTLLAGFVAMLPWCRRHLAETPLALPPLKVYLTQAFGMLTTVCLLAYGLMSERLYTKDVEQSLRQDLANYSQQLSNYATQNRAREVEQLDILVALWRTHLGAGQLPSQAQLDAMFASAPQYLGILLTDAEGNLIRHSSQASLGSRLLSPATPLQVNRDELAQAKATHQTVISYPYLALDFAHQPALTATRAIYADDNFTISGYVQAIVPLAPHQKNLEAIVGDSAFSYIISYAEHPIVLSGQTLNLPMNQPFALAKQSLSSLPLPVPAIRLKLGHRDADYFYNAQMLDTDVTVIVVTSADAVLTQLQQHYLKWVLFIIVASFASVFLGKVLASLFTKPLDSLVHFAGKGNFPIPHNQSSRINFHYREQHQLFSSMVRKAKVLATYHNSLEQQVSARTQELQSLNDRLSRVLQASSDGILEINSRGCINFANEAVAEWLDQSPIDLVGIPIDGLLLPVSGSMTIEQCVHEARFTRTMAEGEGQLRLQDELLELEFNAAPTAMEDGSIGAVVMLRNATSRKEIQRNVEQARRSAELAAQAKSDFVANVSHEIRTPLNAIAGLVQLFGNKNLSPEQKMYLKRMAHGADLLQAIVNDILDFSKIEAGHLELSEQAFDIEALLDNLRLLMLPKAEEKELQLNVELATDVPIGLMGDSLRLSQVLMNLVSNAIKFTKGGHVTVTVTQLPDGDSDKANLRLAVTDSGIGIAHDKLAGLFKPFTQADNATTRQYGGTGLGLAICQRLVSLMGGKLQVSSIPDRGSKFWFDIQLPVAAATDKLLQTPAATTEPANLTFNGQQILVVEDNSVNLQITQLMLSRIGLKTQGAASADEALERLASQPFDLVLMDLQMPDIDGIEATKLIRQRPELRNLPIIALTAHVSMEDRNRCLAAGMQDHMGKPVIMTELVRVLSRHLSYQVDSEHFKSPATELLTEVADCQYLQQQFYERYNKLDVHIRTLLEIEAWQDSRELLNAARKAASDIKQPELLTTLDSLIDAIGQQTLSTEAIDQLGVQLSLLKRQLLTEASSS
ncbi:response regulator [Neiella marina]|uniref:histidine kinase n=1 Tax=Neiella holothuriorum TaxID=2870530 RepID=A0ABS7EIS4_9GAMM|nr:ATP-binding protein [Neiella holothuriorum]MBW8192257.1 response regulator [Neiella holothuriorum]